MAVWIEFGVLFVAMPLGFLICRVRIPKIRALLLTIPDGDLLRTTYSKTKSLLVTSIEHAIYGNLICMVRLGFYS